MKIFVKARPMAKEQKIQKIDENHFEVWVKEPPIKGQANRAIAKALAEHFNVSASQVKLISGFASQNKTFHIHAVSL